MPPVLNTFPLLCAAIFASCQILFYRSAFHILMTHSVTNERIDLSFAQLYSCINSDLLLGFFG